MNNLTVVENLENGLSFELLVDGQPLSELLNDGNGPIPYWIAAHGIPTWPPSGPNIDKNTLIVTVCDCGEYGCGHSRCRISFDNGVVKFSHFAGDVGDRGKSISFSFPESQYIEVINKISKLAQSELQKGS